MTLKRFIALKRSKPLPRKREAPRRGPERDPGYVDWIRSRACVLSIGWECEGPIHAHHAGVRGLGQKAVDSTCIPLCARHHLQGWHDGAVEPFRNWRPGQRRSWADFVISTLRAAYAAETAVQR